MARECALPRSCRPPFHGVANSEAFAKWRIVEIRVVPLRQSNIACDIRPSRNYRSTHRLSTTAKNLARPKIRLQKPPPVLKDVRNPRLINDNQCSHILSFLLSVFNCLCLFASHKRRKANRYRTPHRPAISPIVIPVGYHHPQCEERHRYPKETHSFHTHITIRVAS